MRFNSRVVCEFERDTSKDNCSFATLSLSSTVVIHMYIAATVTIISDLDLLRKYLHMCACNKR